MLPRLNSSGMDSQAGSRRWVENASSASLMLAADSGVRVCGSLECRGVAGRAVAFVDVIAGSVALPLEREALEVGEHVIHVRLGAGLAVCQRLDQGFGGAQGIAHLETITVHRRAGSLGQAGRQFNTDKAFGRDVSKDFARTSGCHVGLLVT